MVFQALKKVNERRLKKDENNFYFFKSSIYLGSELQVRWLWTLSPGMAKMYLFRKYFSRCPLYTRRDQPKDFWEEEEAGCSHQNRHRASSVFLWQGWPCGLGVFAPPTIVYRQTGDRQESESPWSYVPYSHSQFTIQKIVSTLQQEEKRDCLFIFFLGFLGTLFFFFFSSLASCGRERKQICFEEDGNVAFHCFPFWWLILISRIWETWLGEKKRFFPDLPLKCCAWLFLQLNSVFGLKHFSSGYCSVPEWKECRREITGLDPNPALPLLHYILFCGSLNLSKVLISMGGGNEIIPPCIS